MDGKGTKPLELIGVKCCVCDTDDAHIVGLGKDFEYRTCPDTFVAMRCNACGLVYLNPRPTTAEFERIYPANYHAFDFSQENFGFIHKVRSWLEARRLLSFCRGLPDDARIIDVGCGDGFHLNLLRKYGDANWTLDGVDLDNRAAEMAERSGIKVQVGNIEELDLPPDSYDLAIMFHTIEHVENPGEVLKTVRRILKPGGKLVIITDNTDSIDFRLFKGSHWGGYHFPRHWNLFNSNSLSALGKKTGFDVANLTTIVSPVNWVYSIHNWLVDRQRPRVFVDQFTLKSTFALLVFTAFDSVLQILGRGALLRATLQKLS